ncbi:alpha/beta hydrolase [Pseudorhodoferax sp. Leaf265]|uniref:PHA/PHB synthase family protein n=1 Tax=Pseudorhodoferax sp. Leaf265 TaxID=1736315 RepID=UPI0006FC170E|nr:alpha/beta fold hydrolase [Pseudorhodoferax sp. Leaf265]KQP08824.1 poly-beta-hydroxybutyrate polymerase [Pseudorhodoferax sp. Leaf265]
MPHTPSPTEHLDQLVRAALARATGSLSPAAALLAWQDWSAHLAVSPGRQIALAQLAGTQAAALAHYLRDCLLAGPGDARELVLPPAQDRRFAAAAWKTWPFNLLQQSFLLTQQWWDAATHGIAGVEPHHEKMVAFWARQWLDAFSPGNQLATNPLVLQRTAAEAGANLVRGAEYLAADLLALASGRPPAPGGFTVGQDLATTPGQVVLRNRVMELIQYRPATACVHPEPVLIVPAWIMKYYILDLSPHNSLIKHLVDQGHTVFCISWKNPGAAERDLGMDDYLAEGFHAALDAVGTIVPRRRVHATGYCLGGTLLAIAAAAMARDGDARLASVSLFAAQTDFSEPGELGLFIDESQVSLLEAQMAETGYLRASQMAGAFQMLRSYDLLWSRLVSNYLLGNRSATSDLMAWNADATRMPARMHAQYLRRLFLDDDLSEGRYPVAGRPVSLGDLALPIFMVGTTTDHVAPWRSVHKLHFLSPAEITFALTSGGHNAGIVNPPGPDSHRSYQILKRPAGGTYLAPADWQAVAPTVQGSWWPAWQQWLAAHSGAPVQPPRLGATGYPPLADAPGTYVLEK